MFKKLSFGVKLLISILSIVVIGIGILSYTAFYQFKQSLQNEIIDSRLETTEKLAENINTWVSGKLLEVRNSANTSIAKSIESDISAVDKFNAERIKFFNKVYPNEYDNAAAALYNNDGKSRAQYANGTSVIGDVLEKPWYQALMKGADYHVSNPVISKGTGKTITVVGAPIKNDSDKSIGLMMSAVNISYVEDKVKAFKYGNQGYAMLIGADGTVVVHPDKELVMKKKIVDVDDSAIKHLGEKMLSEDSGMVKFSKGNENFIAFYNKIPLSGWRVASVVSEAEIFAPIKKMMMTLFIITLIILTVVGITIKYVSKHMLKPLNKLVGFSEKIASGELNASLDVNQEDEIGKVANSLNDTSIKLREMIGAISESASKTSELSNNLSVITNESVRGTEEISMSMQEIAGGAIRQAEDASTASNITKELLEDINIVINQCREMLKVVEESKKANSYGVKGVQEASVSMETIAETNSHNVREIDNLMKQSKEIGQIVDVISGIADQTNLLALNAAIEAARAGEQGRGFAVVADEVRNLAEQSSESAKQITSLINAIQSQVEIIVQVINKGTTEVMQGVEIVNKVGENFDEIEKAFNNISLTVNDVSKSAMSMAKKADVTSNSISSVASITEENSASTEEVLACVEQQMASMAQIGETSKNLDELVSELKGLIGKFKI